MRLPAGAGGGDRPGDRHHGLLPGFAVPDNPSYDAAASARHWDALRDLYRDRLQSR